MLRAIATRNRINLTTSSKFRRSRSTMATSNASQASEPVSKFHFTPKFTSKLPGDGIDNNTPRQVRKAFWTKANPTPSKDPLELVAWSEESASLIDVNMNEEERKSILEYLVGNKIFPGAEPWAQAYAGFQFGSFAGQLGDGRAISIGEIVNGKGESWELQFKGAGPTPFGRGFDGRAVLRSSIREFLCSEAMHHLGIPTTRAMSLVATGTTVLRETPERGAIVIRMAPTWVRFGTFELQFYTKAFTLVQQLADYVIEHHLPEFSNLPVPEKYSKFYSEVVTRTARMVAHWQAVGWAHGVLNTDNTHILGLTLDYGPFGFLDEFDPDFICNHSDHTGRYSFDAQPQVLFWNLERLARALSPILEYEDASEILGSTYWAEYNAFYSSLMRSKMGLTQKLEDDNEFNDEFISRILGLMARARVDWTIFWRKLSRNADPEVEAELISMFDTRKKKGFNEPKRMQINTETNTVEELEPTTIGFFKDWLAHLRARQAKEQGVTEADRVALMLKSNPKYILRNYLAQQAIAKAEDGDFSEVNKLFGILKRPFDEQPEHEKEYAKTSPEWAQEICVSCSS